MLEKLTLQNFRNYTDRSFTLAPQTVIVGPNGAGKTNILEAVALLSLTTSWRAERDSEVVMWEKPFARIVGDDRELVIQRHPYYKRIRIDGVSKRAGEVLGTMPVTLFHPDDSMLVYGSPAYRRMTMDRLFCQTHTEYSRSLSQLQRVLKQRNKLLRLIQEKKAKESELQYWDAELAVHSEVIKSVRAEALPLLAKMANKVFKELVPENGKVEIEYHQSPRGGVESFLHHLEQNRYKEILSGMTQYGPHREDIGFLWEGHPAAEGMSRGQSRALVIAFKIAELRYTEAQTGIAPILLLDDVFSEFDAKRRERIIELMQEYQTILTVTELGELKKALPKSAKVIELK